MTTELSTRGRVHHTNRWLVSLYIRVEDLAEDLGISKNDAFNILVREALDARDQKKIEATIRRAVEPSAEPSAESAGIPIAE